MAFPILKYPVKPYRDSKGRVLQYIEWHFETCPLFCWMDPKVTKGRKPTQVLSSRYDGVDFTYHGLAPTEQDDDWQRWYWTTNILLVSYDPWTKFKKCLHPEDVEKIGALITIHNL